jgi:hypothetical protein
MTAPQIFWLVLGGVSILMFGVTRLTLYSLKAGRPALRIVLAHLIAVALIAAIGGFDMPYLAGWMRWAYAFALCAFGTLPWLIMDFVRLKLRRGL